MLIFSRKQDIVFCPASFFPSPDSTIIWETSSFSHAMKKVKGQKEETIYHYDSNILLRDNIQAPMTPALSSNFDNAITESLFTKFNEYLRTALFIGCRI